MTSTNHSTAFYLDNILESIELIEDYTFGVGEEAFRTNPAIRDRVLRRLEIIGEDVLHLPEGLRNGNDGVAWTRVAELHETLVHDDTAVDLALAWSIVHRDLASLKRNIMVMRAKQ